MKTIVEYFEQHQLPVALKPSARRKTVALQVKQGMVYVRFPKAMDYTALLAFIRGRETWIKRHLQVQQHQVDAFGLPAGKNDLLWYLGQEYPLQVFKTSHQSQAWFDEEVWHVALNERLRRSESDSIKQVLQVALKKEAQAYLVQRTAFWSERTGLTPNAVSVQSFRGVWGRCRRSGEVDLNWRLLFGHPEAIDYVIIHELVHLKEFNHSARFWRQVATICPDFERWRSYWHARGVWLSW